MSSGNAQSNRSWSMQNNTYIPSLLQTYVHIVITRICHYIALYGTKDVANVSQVPQDA